MGFYSNTSTEINLHIYMAWL